MLKSLYTLSEQYKNKKIIIFGINRSSVIVFSKLALNHQVDIDSFWDMDHRFVREYFVNRRIISTEELHRMKDVIVVIPEAYERQEVQQRAGKNAEVLYMDEILDLNEELSSKKIYIYGIGGRGGSVHDALREKGIEVEGVYVTKPGRVRNWCGKEVCSVKEMRQKDNGAVIIAADIERFRKEMLAQIENMEMEKFVVSFMSDNVITEGNFFQVINYALYQHKDIWLYSCGDEGGLYLEEILDRYQIGIARKISGESVYDLVYEDVDNISVVIAEKNELKMEQICDTLDRIGFGLERWNYTATGLCTCKVALHAVIKRDLLVGNSVFETERYPGYIVYGDEEKAKVRIMVLGGSTSTENVFRTISWVRFFYERLFGEGYAPVIYNGAVCGYGIVDEFLHMVRDIEPLKPDYVISFSGINNTHYRKTANQFNISSAERAVVQNGNYISGVESSETLYDFWYRISKLMRVTARQNGAKTYNFLQPMSAVKENMDLMETVMFDYAEHTEHIRNYKAKALTEKNQFYINLISMFEGKKVYIDNTHYCTDANRIIAERVFEVMESDLREMLLKRM